MLAPRKLQSIIYNFKASFKTFHSAGVRPPVPILWQTEKHLLRNPLQRWKAKRSPTWLASNDTPRNSGWENYQWDDPTQHFATLADRARKGDLSTQHFGTTLYAGRDSEKRHDPTQHLGTQAERTRAERSDPTQHIRFSKAFRVSPEIGSLPRPLSFVLSRIPLDRLFPWGTRFAPESITPSRILHASGHQMESAVKRQE